MTKRNISKIAVFLDGSPGHEKQTLGIVKQLKKKIDFEVIKCRVEKPSLIAQFINWFYYFWNPAQLMNCNTADVDLAIGTGTHTHLSLLTAKKSSNIHIVTCMSPAPYLIDSFDLIFAPNHDNVASRENVVATVGPPNINENKNQHEENSVLILIGGADPKSHIWNDTAIIHSVEKLISYEADKKFVMSSSPRTPINTEEKLGEIAGSFPNVEFHRFKETPSGWVEQQYSRSRYVWVTGDSISMVYEALSSGCKVGIIPVTWKAKNSKFLRSINYLQEKLLTVELEAYLNGKATWKKNCSLNEAERCAEEILRRLG